MDFDLKASEVKKFVLDKLIKDSRVCYTLSSTPKEILESKARIDFENEMLRWLKKGKGRTVYKHEYNTINPTDNFLIQLKRKKDRTGNPYIFKAPDLCKLIGVSRMTLYNWEREGRFSAPRNLAGARVFTEEQLRAIVQAFSPSGNKEWHFQK